MLKSTVVSVYSHFMPQPTLIVLSVLNRLQITSTPYMTQMTQPTDRQQSSQSLASNAKNLKQL
jgi:hypothetical protein